MFRRQHNQTKRPEGNENDVESPVINRKNKQFGPASAKALNSPLQRSESGLKFKSANQKEVKNNKNDDSKLQKQSDKIIPQKRANIPSQQKEAKKQNIGPIEVTHRHREEEIEWAPAGLDLDFGDFSSTIEEYHTNDLEINVDMMDEGFPDVGRQFNQPIQPIAEDEKDTQELFTEQDTNTIEYAPPKEKELPFKPDESVITDFNVFSEDADLAAYVLNRHYHTLNNLEVPVYENEDIWGYDAIDNDSLEFEYTFDDDEPDLSSSGPDFSSIIPYYDYEFDVEQFVKCN